MLELNRHADRSDDGDGDIQAVSDLVIVAGAMRRVSIVVAGGDRVADLLLLEAAQDHGMVDRVILVGDERRIREAIEQTHVTVADTDIIPAADDRATATATIECAQAGHADIIIKGGIPTSTLYRELAALNRGVQARMGHGYHIVEALLPDGDSVNERPAIAGKCSDEYLDRTGTSGAGQGADANLVSGRETGGRVGAPRIAGRGAKIRGKGKK